ncbi:glycosyltransferase [Candidatus Woesearchaeota archaeon]|nr:glycosyltransferase [Candidatus Woesearchaeota archaeon]
MKKFIVIPAYNEEKVIKRVISDLKEHNYENIIVVDDCSKDNTSKIALKQGAVVLNHIVNRGQGAAIKTGIDYSLKKDADIIITFDADGQHRAEDIESLIKPIKKGEADICLGSRFLDNRSNVPLYKKVVLKCGIYVIRAMYGIKLTDVHNGLRAMNRKAAKKIEIKSNRMEHASEILEEIKKKKLRYKEIPVVIRYTDYSKKKGQSSWNALKIFLKMMIKKIVD